MPVDNILAVRDVHDLADAPVHQHLIERAEEWRVAQHMADQEPPPGVLGRVRQLDAAGAVGRHRFFEHHIVARAHGRHRGRDMLPILGAYQRARAQLRQRQQLLPVSKAALGWNAMQRREALTPLGVGLGHGDKTRLGGMLQRVRGVAVCAA